MNNTPFNVPTGMIGNKDVVTNVPNNFSSATGVNAEKIARQINSGASKVISRIDQLKKEIASIPVDEELGLVSLDSELVKRIQLLTDNVYVAFEELLKIGR